MKESSNILVLTRKIFFSQQTQPCRNGVTFSSNTGNFWNNQRWPFSVISRCLMTLCHVRRGWESCACSARRRHLIHVHEYLMWGSKGMEPGCSQWCPATGQETMNTNWNRVGEKELTAFYRVKVVRHWHKLNREGRKSPSLEISNIHQAQPRPACCCSLPELGVGLGNLQKCLPTVQTFVILYYQTYSEAIYDLEA